MLKKETKKELDKLAEIMYEKFGEECYNLDNFIKLVIRIAYTEVKLSHYTIRKDESQRYLVRKIKELESPFELLDDDDDFLDEELKVDKVLVQTIRLYSDGTYEIEDKRVEEAHKLVNSIMEETEQKLNEMAVGNFLTDYFKEEEKQWRGMFNYNGGKKEIRIGQYMGCDLNDKESIKKYFVDWKKGRSIPANLYGYVCHCLTPKELNKIKRNWCGEKSNQRDEEEHQMNIQTLKEIKERIEKSYPYPGTLAEIRREKGLI